MNDRFYSRIEVVRKVQKYTITKNNIDSRYTNIYCYIARGQDYNNKEIPYVYLEIIRMK